VKALSKENPRVAFCYRTLLAGAANPSSSIPAKPASGAFGGLEVAVIIAALLMAVGSAWGPSRRLAEYR
jgi:hypothetical protein